MNASSPSRMSTPWKCSMSRVASRYLMRRCISVGRVAVVEGGVGVLAAAVVVQVVVVPVDVADEVRPREECEHALLPLVFREAMSIGHDVARVETESDVVAIDIDGGLMPVLRCHAEIFVALRPVNLFVGSVLDVICPVAVVVFEDELEVVPLAERGDFAYAEDKQVILPISPHRLHVVVPTLWSEVQIDLLYVGVSGPLGVCSR